MSKKYARDILSNQNNNARNKRTILPIHARAGVPGSQHRQIVPTGARMRTDEEQTSVGC